MSPRTVIALLATGVCALAPGAADAARVLRMDRHGVAHALRDPFLGQASATMAPRTGRRAALRASAARTKAAAAPRTPGILDELLVEGAIDQATHDRAMAAFDRTTELTHKLTGGRLAAVRGVLADLESMAARGEVIPERLPALVATLEANNQWWTTGPLLASGARVEFVGSQIVWQHYPGHGIQIQWLGTWGRANGLWRDGHRNQDFAALLAEAVGLAGRRNGGLAFEYLFPFDGGRPPWVSGLAQGTALSALVRGGRRLKDPVWSDDARSAVGIFRLPPPVGIAQPTAVGTHYLQYSFAPKLHVLNGFVQSLNGLYDYATFLKDAEGDALLEAGRAEAAAELPSYDTGGWSRYSEYRDSNRSYHDLLREFLAGLCRRLAGRAPEDAPFCLYADRFAADLVQAPAVTVAGSSPNVLRARRPARVLFSIDKPATVTMTIRRGHFRYVAVVPIASGAHSFGWKPGPAGRYRVTLTARDLAGNTFTVPSAATVRRPIVHHPKR